MSRRVLSVILIVLSLTTASGQQPRTPERAAELQTPTFRLQVEYVEVDARVTDAKGNFVRDLTKDDFVRILHEPRNSLTKQQSALLGAEGIDVEFSEESIDTMAQIAFDLNRRTQNIGARRLYTILERVLEKISFEGPDMADKKVVITPEYVRERLGDVLKDEDLSRFIL